MSETGVKALNRAGATGPPNNTKEAPQLFGGKTSLQEAPSSALALTLILSAELCDENCNEIITLNLWVENLPR